MRWLRVLAIQMLIVVVLLEVALRLYNPIVSRVRGSEIVLPVKQVYRFDNGAGVRRLDRHTLHTKNVLGFRGPDPPRDFAERLTVLTIGGSTTECVFLSDGRTWTDVLSARLAPDFPALWINNAGIDGHTTFGHLVLLRSLVTRLRPSVAVFLVGANDVGLEAANTFDDGVTPRGGVRRAMDAAVSRSEVASLALNLVRAARARERGLGHSEVDLTTAPRLVLSDMVMAETEARHRALLPAYAARLEAIVAETRGAGIEPVLMTQPALFGDGVDPATGVALGEVQVNGRGNGRLEWRLLEMVNDETRRVAAARQVRLIDLARTLPKDSRYFYDFIHFTNEGAAAVGEIVAAGLRPALAQKAPGPAGGTG